MSDLIASVSGVRGIFGESINPRVAMHYAAKFGVFCQRGKIIVGRDSRTTGEAMFQAISAGLMAVGCDVVDLGIVPTPTVLLAVEESDAAGGIAITASHNPAEWNAMKFVADNGMFLYPEAAEIFLEDVTTEIKWSDWQAVGKLTNDAEAAARHIEKILRIPYLNINEIKERKFKVVLDSVNGAGGLISPQLLRALGCEVIELNSEPTGIFAHPPEPLNRNIAELEQAVKQHQADIGFATDPDVDRLAVVSEKGVCIGEELSVALAEIFILSKSKGDIVVNLSSSLISEHIARQFGVNVIRTKVGEINVGKKMKEIGSPVGGEGNGGIICPEVHYTRDALAGMAIILGLLAQEKRKLSEIVSDLPSYHFAKGKIETTPLKIKDIMEYAYYAFEGMNIDTADGVKASGENYWIHVRKSGTEPIIRIYVESDDQKKSELICQKTIEKLLAH